MLDTDDAIDPNANAARLRFLTEGLPLHVSDLADGMGGYSCSIVETEGRVLWIDLPIRRDGMLDLAPGQLVSVRFDRVGDAAYLFDSVVAEVRADDRAPFGLARPLTINRRAHRADPRIALVLDATFGLPAEDEPTTRDGKVVDLSAGGLGLICDTQLAEGTQAVVRFDLPGPDGDLGVERRCGVRTTSMYGRTPAGVTLHHHGLQFLDDDDESREQILSAVIWNLTQNPTAL